MRTEDPREVPSPAGSDGRSDASVVTQFFLLPLAVVAGLVGVFLLFTLATRNPPTARDHLNTLHTGRFNQRWQAAFELSNLLRDGNGARNDPTFLPQLIEEFRKSVTNTGEDPRVRRYLALALGNSGSDGAASPLLEAVAGRDPECRLYALWGLARLQTPLAEPAFLAGLQDPDPSIRSVSAYGLGMTPTGTGKEDLVKALRDPVEEVRWNAALALGRKGDASGKEILVQLLDRSYLAKFPSMEEGEKTSTMLNAMRALKYLKIMGLNDKLQDLASSDPDARIREAAKAWILALKT